MISLYLSDLFTRANIKPKEVKLIRHALSDKNFKKYYSLGMLQEYTQLQKKDFSKGYKYWMIFISDKSTNAKFEGIYKVKGATENIPEAMPINFPFPEHFDGNGDYFDLERLDILKELEDRLIIDWGNATRSWHQKGTTDKKIVAIQSNQKFAFEGFENLILSFKELKEIVEDSIVYENWHTALASVYAIYLIVDTINGNQYIGSAYGIRGLLGRWETYIKTKHGDDKKIIKLLQECPYRYEDFQFSVLQILPKNIMDEEVIKIESLWKKKLQTKEFGLNDN